jgi:hypothetical protein
LTLRVPDCRDDKLDLATLGSVAREFDQISRESGRDWPPVSSWSGCATSGRHHSRSSATRVDNGCEN